MLDRATNEPNISDMLGFKDKADSLCKKYLDEFAEISAPIVTKEDDGESGKDDKTAIAKPPVPKKK